MAIKNHILGFPRIGLNRELKFALEKYWSKKNTLEELLLIGKNIRKENWKNQIDSGMDYVTVGDFAWYDHVLNISMMINNIPERHNPNNHILNIDTLFKVARGSKGVDNNICSASEMTKWFNTNYHYIVPEFTSNQKFYFAWKQILEETDEALSLGYKVKPVLLGPLTYLWLGKVKNSKINKLDLLKKILPIYIQVFKELSSRNINWIQIDEPILVLDIPKNWKKEFQSTYKFLDGKIKILLATYFGDITHNLDIINKLSIQGLHIDLVSSKYDLLKLSKSINNNFLLSLGIINGRNIWKTNLLEWFYKLKDFMKINNNFWISSSCSLLHVPLDITIEENLTDFVKSWFSFGIQKCLEISLLSQVLQNNLDIKELKNWIKPIHEYKSSNIVNNTSVQKRTLKISSEQFIRKNEFSVRSKIQKETLCLPVLPTTTIGSFPQTSEIRKLRLDYKNKKINQLDYEKQIKIHIKKNIIQQEQLGLDVLVHGEPERNDMVEYFSEYLEGFVFTTYGWVQSYGSRCVKPPIIVGDISRITPMTVMWSKYAQSLTKKPVKAMLTGPVTILCWSFPREDISKEDICNQIAISLRDEVLDLENSGINIIQIDEPALREGLPLRTHEWNNYLRWAVKSFKICSSGVKNSTQIHTHMCYCEFNDIMPAIVDLDADVITIETSRSDMELLEFFKTFKYPNAIGPGVYDIHSPNIPSVQSIEKLLKKALKYISIQQLWVNPDCGLKTRNWTETSLALQNMLQATLNIRKEYFKK
ncbi:5-methyltetrahydropteroyltriglutamate--homocysteine S-methyltransferase [Buchnera aphidicola]|uniref:5-methyltetrahydropteroyltriglutamate--homocysteine methyltransferase n=1 Tax=Buchnera aphidicola subsp. Cinara cedri (strain Cc) TaxID=372461 RepID=METE_BUCCC|nr:5-methyltetrahydropteroyltriglutamate--homocysteine S-methyltransferase [Buchnera aphidicola]Q058E7.1 RecName: Full=5-methyltetrahydropteroyltriglutamate--homocysteine methyltransferase; AltName: Full=Cobalamin-independent methionine synthase; AltName: Full=Methionine synthase, vitamin-B12 independent isozyme [Buchnera aphidicola BCc]ABJ90502.1 5-methyltetrahydropteroyltriglutamate-homocysteine S-methyltransferase [Buchnera aphidicola BCc]